MKYIRTFHLTAAHFNGSPSYERWSNILNNGEKWPWHILITNVTQALMDCHGHDFEVTVEVGLSFYATMVVEDEQLEALLKKYDRCNWSVLTDLSLLVDKQSEKPLIPEVHRATTERVANRMCGEVADLVVKAHERQGGIMLSRSGWVEVTIKETNDIKVVAERNLNL